MENGKPFGKIFTAEEAEKYYGKPIVSSIIQTAAFDSFFQKSDSVLMFNIIDKKPYILGNKRRVLFPEGEKIAPEIVFAVYPVEIVKELLDKGGRHETAIEVRKEVVTVSNGNYTLNLQQFCPPFCP